MTSAARRWAEALAAWAIPEEILAQAPADPWTPSPGLFRVPDPDPAGDTPSLAAARRALDGGGSVLDVGCGTGASSLPLAPAATVVTGVDERSAMLERFVDNARSRGVEVHPVLGRWPDIAADVAPADVVVCHHVVYNVAEIGAFLVELVAHARRTTVLELTEHHPQTSLNHLWAQFWGIERPTQPSAGLLFEVLDELALPHQVHWRVRPARRPPTDQADHVAMVRRRLCLEASRDGEVAAVLDAMQLDPDRVATVVLGPGRPR